MEHAPRTLRLVPRHGHARTPDVGLLAFLVAVHAVPLLAVAAGRPWGAGAAGYGAAVVALGGRELVRELFGRGRW